MLRFVLDDAGFDFDDLTDQEIENSVRVFAEELMSLRQGEDAMAVPCGWGTYFCSRDGDLGTFLARGSIQRDLRDLVLSLLDKCERWDEDSSIYVEGSVTIGGLEVESFGSAWALEESAINHGWAVVTLPHTGRRGVRIVENREHRAPVHFMINHQDHPRFYQSLLAFEDLPEPEFFSMAPKAFPRLVLVPTLSFSHFAGSYTALREGVVLHLAAIDGLFLPVLAETAGIPKDVSSRVGIDLSLESVKTRSSRSLMKHRQVHHDGQEYTCEWHSKLERHQNRIHFCPTENHEQVIIGIFAEHLPT